MLLKNLNLSEKSEYCLRMGLGFAAKPLFFTNLITRAFLADAVILKWCCRFVPLLCINHIWMNMLENSYGAGSAAV